MNLSVQIASEKYKNPVTVASGTFGFAEKYYELDEVKQLGAIVPKTVTLYKQEGNPPPRIVETPSGMINAIGIENPGIDVFIKEKLVSLKKIGVPIIVSILGHTDEQFVGLVEKLNSVKGVSALELNLSCPNLKQKTLAAQDPIAARRIIEKVKRVSNVPIIAKLSPNVTDIADIAKAVEDGGADAVSLINTLTAMSIDIKTKRSNLGNFTGGLSGPAIRPVAVHMVYKVSRSVKIPIIAMGGIACAKDALEFIIAGATMVAVGTFSFVNPKVSLEILNGIKDYMKENKINDINYLIGSVVQ